MSGAPTLDLLLGLERQVWEALRTGDAAADAALLSADFLGVYPSGFAGRAEHVAQIGDGPGLGRYSLSDARMIVVSDEAALLCYEAVYARPGAAEARMLVSSLWMRRGGARVNVFSQDTPVGG